MIQTAITAFVDKTSYFAETDIVVTMNISSGGIGIANANLDLLMDGVLIITVVVGKDGSLVTRIKAPKTIGNHTLRVNFFDDTQLYDASHLDIVFKVVGITIPWAMIAIGTIGGVLGVGILIYLAKRKK